MLTKGRERISSACFEARWWIHLQGARSALAHLGDGSKSWCCFSGGKRTPYTASLLLAEVLEICFTEGEEKSAAHSALLLTKRACRTVCISSEMKGSFFTRVVCHYLEKTNCPFLLFSVWHFHHTMTAFLGHVVYQEGLRKLLSLGHFFYILTNSMLKVLNGNVDHVCIEHYYLQWPHLGTSLEMGGFITLSTLPLFNKTLAIGGAQWVCLNLPCSCQPCMKRHEEHHQA